MQIIKNKDKSYSDKIIYNDYISLSGKCPSDAYKYKINSKSPLEWVVDKQSYISDEKKPLGLLTTQMFLQIKRCKQPSLCFRIVTEGNNCFVRYPKTDLKVCLRSDIINLFAKKNF